jgi:ubiquinone/menaquinone biosynthesis C-methylase UbiE
MTKSIASLLRSICRVSLSDHANYDIDDDALYPPDAQRAWAEYQQREIPKRISALNRIGNWPLGATGRWLDVGAGTGIFARALRDMGNVCDCVEVSVPETKRLVADGFKVFGGTEVIADASYNRIHCNAVIEHVTDADGFAHELFRVCSQGGRVYIGTISESSILVLASLLRLLTCGLWKAHHYVCPWHVHYMGTASWCRMLLRAGFSIEMVWTTPFQQPPRRSLRSLIHRLLGLYHVNIVATKP